MLVAAEAPGADLRGVELVDDCHAEALVLLHALEEAQLRACACARVCVRAKAPEPWSAGRGGGHTALQGGIKSQDKTPTMGVGAWPMPLLTLVPPP